MKDSIRYGLLPIVIEDEMIVRCDEMMFYQYLPIKLRRNPAIKYEMRLHCFDELINTIVDDFIFEFGLEEYNKSYIYLTAKHLYQAPDKSFNREGWHSDGFMTNDINYIWSDCCPTIFNSSHFNLTMDDNVSLIEMTKQADPKNDFYYNDNSILRLNQFNIHKVGPIEKPVMRTFVKLSFSQDKYDLIGNSHNSLFCYDWEMKLRKVERNIPQTDLKTKSKIIGYEN